MIPRIATSVVGIPLLILIVWAGSPWFSILTAVAAAIAAFELSQMARQWGDRPFIPIAVAGAVGLVVAAHYLAIADGYSSPPFPAILVIILSALALLWILSRGKGVRKSTPILATLAIILFAGGTLAHAPLLRELPQGFEWVLFLLLVTFATDTGAFFVGRAIGRRRLAPSISPGKTQEGAVGGFLAAIVASAALGALFDLDISLWKIILLGALVGIAGQFGDLTESRIKRIAGAKDSGRLFPGHGGILDRLDSIVFNLVVVYYFVA